jgi:hypothetical protein
MWRETELYRDGKIELLPTEWVYRFRNVDADPFTDLKNGRIVGLDQLWENILEEGLHDPLIMRVCRFTRAGRLETGNHRIWVFKEKGIPFVPVAVEIGFGVVGNPGNGFHSYDMEDDLLVPHMGGTRDSFFDAPSNVFRTIMTYKALGQLGE